MTFDSAGALQEILDLHGMQAETTDQGILIPESGLVISIAVVRVQNHPTNTTVQLDVRATSPRLGDRLLIESFGGWGSDEYEATERAFQKFLRASMHVLLAVLVDPKYGAHQVEWELWNLGDRSWNVCLGPVTLQGQPPDGLVCGELLDRFKAELLPGLGAGYHWFRFFFWKNGGVMVTIEALLDGLDWPEGRKIIEATKLPDGPYSAREFLMLHV